MIRWCAGCQRYMGEAPPWSDYNLTHGLCPDCANAFFADDNEYHRRSKELSDFYNQLRQSAKTGKLESVDDTLQKCLGLGLRPLDLMIGIIQPILQEIGLLWSKGTVTVAAEHQFSTFSNAMIALVYAKHPELHQYRQSQSPRFLLINAEDNFHVMGIQLVELSLAMRRIGSYTVIPGLPVSEVIQLVIHLKPKVLGLSIALAAQMKSVREILSMLEKLDEGQRPKVLIGGGPTREGLMIRPEFDVITCRSLAEFETFLDKTEI